MSAVLRAYGKAFDVELFLEGCTLPVCAVKRRGDAVHPRRPEAGSHERSGIHLSASDADFAEFPRQVAETVEFLHRQAEQIRRLCEFPGVEEATLDFGFARRDVAVQTDFLPPELIRLAAAFGLGIEVSQYPPADAESPA